MFNKIISNTYTNFPQILIFMTFNQTFLYGDMRGNILLLGLFINWILYIILNTTTQIVSTSSLTGMPSKSAQFMFFYIGFHIANMISKSEIEFTNIKLFYLIILGLMTLFITLLVGGDNLPVDDNISGRILGALVGFTLGGFYYTLVSYKYNIKGEDTKNKTHKICKGGKKYKCKVKDLDQMKDSLRKDQAKLEVEESVQETMLEAITHECNSCDKKI